MVSGHASPAAVAGVAIAVTALACIFVAMRLYARLCLARSAGLDDLCIVFSMVGRPPLSGGPDAFTFAGSGERGMLTIELQVFSIATMATMIIQVETGTGRHAKEIEPHELVRNLKAVRFTSLSLSLLPPPALHWLL